jgi:threonine aldolase
MPKKLIDLRSDTVTRPSSGMRKAMANAVVGDDVFGDDPTVKILEAKIARLFGREAALFVPSGTMANQISLRAWTRPGDEVLCEADAHILHYEMGAAGALAGVQLRPLQGEHGILSAEQVKAAIRPKDGHQLPTTLVALENSHNRAGGTVYPLQAIKDISKVARAKGLKVYLDGARIWNASAASGVPLKEYARNFNSVSACFSKGLGCPIGSIVIGDKEFVARARVFRRMYGGAMRQVGILAACSLYALKHNLPRLHEDHAKARLLAEGLADLPGIDLDLSTVQTNIVVFDVSGTGRTPEVLTERLARANVLVVPFGTTRLRAVCHLDVNRDDILSALRVFQGVFRKTR